MIEICRNAPLICSFADDEFLFLVSRSYFDAFSVLCSSVLFQRFLGMFFPLLKLFCLVVYYRGILSACSV